jgi:hypothetical protein
MPMWLFRLLTVPMLVASLAAPRLEHRRLDFDDGELGRFLRRWGLSVASEGGRIGGRYPAGIVEMTRIPGSLALEVSGTPDGIAALVGDLRGPTSSGRLVHADLRLERVAVSRAGRRSSVVIASASLELADGARSEARLGSRAGAIAVSVACRLEARSIGAAVRVGGAWPQVTRALSLQPGRSASVAGWLISGPASARGQVARGELPARGPLVGERLLITVTPTAPPPLAH